MDNPIYVGDGILAQIKNFSYSYPNTITKEYKKCLGDPIYFIEKYCLINNKFIKLKDYQKAFIKYVSRSKRN